MPKYETVVKYLRQLNNTGRIAMGWYTSHPVILCESQVDHLAERMSKPKSLMDFLNQFSLGVDNLDKKCK